MLLRLLMGFLHVHILRTQISVSRSWARDPSFHQEGPGLLLFRLLHLVSEAHAHHHRLKEEVVVLLAATCGHPYDAYSEPPGLSLPKS